MDRARRPQLSDWMNVSNALFGVAQQKRDQKLDQKRMDYYDAQAQNQMARQQQSRQEELRKRKTAELSGMIADNLRQGKTFDQMQFDMTDTDPRVVKNAKFEAVKQLKEEEAYSQEQMAAKAKQWEQDRQALGRALQKAEAARQAGDTQTANQIIDTAYNEYVYDGRRIVDRKPGKDGADTIALEPVDGGKSRKFKDDLGIDQKISMLAQAAKDPKEYLNQRIAADKGRREYNAEQWKDPVPVKGEGGKTYWMVKQIDPGEHRPSVLIFDHEPDVDSEPIAIEGSRQFKDKQALELDKAYKEGRQPDIPSITKNKAINVLQDYFYKPGAMGAIEARMKHSDEKYKMAEERFNELIKQTDESGAPVLGPHEAAIQARNFVEKAETAYFNKIAEDPENKEYYQQKYRQQYGYLPNPEDRPAGVAPAEGDKGGGFLGILGG